MQFIRLFYIANRYNLLKKTALIITMETNRIKFAIIP